MVRLAPAVRLTPVVRLAPVVRLTPVVQLAPVVRLTPVVQLAPVVRLAPAVRLAPVVRLARLRMRSSNYQHHEDKANRANEIHSWVFLYPSYSKAASE